MAEVHASCGFESVLMLGDNIYGGQQPKEFRAKFELPYAELLRAGVQFHAVLGNHDSARQLLYPPFHMDGRRYYSFRPRENVTFFGLDSNHMDEAQLAWLENELAHTTTGWKIAWFHHPLYSSGGKHGSTMALRAVLEPLFVKYGVSVVLSGHDHFYERFQPQNGITYFVAGGAGQLRAGDARASETTAKAFDRDRSFLVMEIDGDLLHLRAIGRTGKTVDEGTIYRRK